MKHLKKIMALALAAFMALAVAMPALAATIEVQNVLDDETYTAYKILNYRKANDSDAVSYYLTSSQYTSIGSVLEAAGFEFTKSSDGTEYFVNNAATFDAAAAAEYLGGHVSDLGSALGTATATGSNGSAQFTNLTPGYYFVTSTTGSLCALHEDTGIATVVEKNTTVTVDKTESMDGENYVDGPVDANIGDTVHYQIVITDGTGTDKVLTMTDTLSAGLDYTAGSLKINGTAVADDANTDNWTVTVNGRVITIEFKAAYVAALDAEDTITVTYDATINANAVIDSATGNDNTVELDYSRQHDEDKVYVETYDFQLYKTDGTSFLDGAEFTLYDAATGGNKITLTQDETGYYVGGADDVNIVVDSANGVNVRGLAPGTYYLEEVVVPDGYNKLAAREDVTITTGATAAVEITVENQAGTVMPSTGGIGTTIFYIIGGVLLAGGAIVLISKRRVADMEK